MQAQDLLWRIQHVHERIVHTLAMVDKSVAAQPANSSPALQGLQTPERGSRVHSVAPGTPSILSTLARARRSLHLHLMEERKLLREYALAVGVQEKLLPPAFDRTCRFVASTPIQPSAHMEHFSTTPQKTQPTAALPDADSFDVRFMLQLRQTLIGQLAPLLRQPVSIGEELVVQHVLRTEDFHRAQVLLSDITKITKSLHLPIIQPQSMLSSAFPTPSSSMPPSSVSVGRSSVQSGSASSHDASDSHDVTADVPDTNARTARKLFDSPASLPVVASPPAVGVSSKQAFQALTSRLAAISAGTPKQYELRAESQEPAISAASSIPLSLAKSECHESMPQPDSPATVDASPDPPAVLNVSGFDRLLSKIFAGAQSSVPAPSALSAPTASAIAVSPAVPAEACESDSDSGEDSEDAADVRETIELAMRQHRAVAATAYHDFLSVANNTSFSRMVTSPTASEIGDSFEDVLASDAEDSCDGSDAGTSPVRNRPAIQLPTPSKPIPFHKAIHSYPPLPSEELASPPVLPRSSSRLSARLAGFSPGPPQGMTLSNPASPICGDGVSPLGPGDASVVFLDVDSSFVLTPQRFSSSMPSQPKRHARSKLSENVM